MKNFLFSKNIGYLAAAWMLAAAACTNTPKTTPPQRNDDSKVSLYSLEAGRTDPARSTEIGAKLLGQAFDAGAVKMDDNKTTVYFQGKEPSVTFAQDLATGDFSFSKSTERYTDGKFTPELPDPQSAQKMAMEFLRSYNLAPQQAGELKMVHAGGLRAAAAGKPNQVKDIFRTIYYGRLLDSLPVLGPGSRIVVQIGDKGEVVGATRRWRELAKTTTAKRTLKTAEVKTEKEATEEAAKVIASEFGANAKYAIRKAQMAYFDQGGSYIQPVYAVEATVTLSLDDKETVIPYLCVIEMMKSSPERLTVRTLEPRAQELLQSSKDNFVPDNLKIKRREDD